MFCGARVREYFLRLRHSHVGGVRSPVASLARDTTYNSSVLAARARSREDAAGAATPLQETPTRPLETSGCSGWAQEAQEHPLPHRLEDPKNPTPACDRHVCLRTQHAHLGSSKVLLSLVPSGGSADFATSLLYLPTVEIDSSGSPLDPLGCCLKEEPTQGPVDPSHILQ
ncbi:hypothetical protein NDU88_009480 [Pleurodeles waltl]|uniref:Uncharacterized protein n=1 Tax=Pleurodeles waltl TaxID=8319 RepID=A0AAV7QTS1_PLEWA|nr:hypothetical protein NDU88_009480 [Pleurodeles waltl]